MSSTGRRPVRDGAAARRAVTTSAAAHLSSDRADDGRAALAGLAARAAGGDRAAMEQLLLEAQAVAWRFSHTVCGHSEDAEDVMQEALVQTYRFVSRLREPEAFRPWLYRTVRNACLMSRRRRVDEPSHMLSLDELLPAPDASPRHDAREPGRDPEQILANAGLHRRLTRALAKLPPPFRMVLFLREMEGLSTREVAMVAGLSEDNVKARLHRARLFMQRELAPTDARRSTPPRRQPRPRNEGRR
jgi:RNA polymerase sigma-70 factor (ECF subfamily)